MRKTTKLLAIILALITLVSSFSIASGAISSKSSAKELLNYYEDCIIKTSAKEDVIKAEVTYKSKDVADYSYLEGEDLEATKAQDAEWELFTGKWDESKDNYYYFCDKYEDYYYDGRSEYVDYFSIKRDIRRYELQFKSAKYSKADNGDITLNFVYLSESEWTDEKETYKYTVVINSKGYLKSYKIERQFFYETESVESNPYIVKCTMVETYKFVYNKVDAVSMEIPEKTIVLGKDEEYILDVTIKPDNATFKDYYIDAVNMDWDIADYYFNDNDECVIFAAGPGTTTFDIYTYSGDIVETVEVVVEYTFFERIVYFFENLSNEITWFFDDIYYEIMWFFEDLFYTEDYYEDFEEVYEEELIVV